MNYQEEINKIVEWMKMYAHNNGSNGYVIGISGGIDSAVITALSCMAVGKENVKGINISCYSSINMALDADQLAKNLGIKLKNVNIDKEYDNIVGKIQNGFQKINKLSTSNIKARLRMTILYAIANEYNCLVAGTGNLSELSVGYFTKWGDGAVDIEPLGNYYKKEVYEIAKLIPEIPQEIIDKKPSADLYVGQTDEDELGMSYKELDEILESIHNPHSPSLDKFPIDKLTKVQEMINFSRHKNNMPPRYERY